jgi:DNA-directed RNA polymerase sigma subunit (sigma70/sigma32)
MKGVNSKSNKISPEEKSSIKKVMRDLSLQEIGDELGLTRMRICQLEKSILSKLKKDENVMKLMQSE